VIKCTPAPVESLRAEAPPELVQIIRHAMAKSPGDRYQTAGDMRNDLTAFAGQREFAGDPPRPPSRTTQVIERSKWIGGTVAGVVIGVALGAWYLWPEEATAPAPVVQTRVAPPPVKAAEDAAPNLTSSAAATSIQAARPALERKAAPVPATPPPPTDGTVALAISPWGEVFVNGTSRGVSPPLNRLTLAAGSYSIEVRNSAGPAYSSRVEVKPGQTVTLQHRF
jgi:serine/threonine-protein kinase